MEYLYTARFLRSLKKMTSPIQDDVILAVKLFETGRENESLKLHKLHGEFHKYHAFSANFSYRIIVKVEKQTTYFMDVGTHDVYK